MSACAAPDEEPEQRSKTSEDNSTLSLLLSGTHGPSVKGKDLKGYALAEHLLAHNIDDDWHDYIK